MRQQVLGKAQLRLPHKGQPGRATGQLLAWPTRARVALWLVAAGYTGLWLLALLRGLNGAVWLPPPV